MNDKTITILFGRHGETSEDIPGRERVTGWKQTPLDERGRAQARALGRFLKGKGITKILSSDTRRTLETAQIVGEIIGVPVVKTHLLRSWNMGALQGMYSKVAKPFLEFFELHPDARVPKGEKFRAFFNRLRTAFRAIVAFAKRFPDSNILVMTHSQDLDLVEWLRDGIEPGKAFEFGEGIPPGGCEEVRIHPDGKITIRKLFGKGTEKGG